MKGLKHITICALVAVILTPIFHRAASFIPVDRIHAILALEAQGLSVFEREEISRTVTNLSKEYRLDPLLILAVMKVESNFDSRALSNHDARGLMQVRPIVVREVADDLDISAKDSSRLYEQAFNLRVGVHYLAGLIRKFGGDLKKALMAYNAGPTSVARLYKNRPAPEGGYQGRVLKAYRLFSDS